MAANESDREDLMREAVALSERTELQVAGFDDLITIGFRTNSAMSVFIGQDPVYQFDASGRLRRAFVDGFLFRSQHQTLARLGRVRSSAETQLLRYELIAEELTVFRTTMMERLSRLNEGIQQGHSQIVRTVPEGSDLRPKILIAFHAILQAVEWLSPEIRPRR